MAVLVLALISCIDPLDTGLTAKELTHDLLAEFNLSQAFSINFWLMHPKTAI